MNLTDGFVLKCLRGSPVLLDDICAIYPATLGEIVDEGYDNFQKYLGVITAEKPTDIKKSEKELQDAIKKLTDFQFILLLTSMDIEFNKTLKQAFFFFTKENVSFSLDPAQIIVGPLQEQHILTEEKFYELQQIIRKMYFLESNEDIVINKNDSEAVKALKLKMRENRKKVQKIKQKQAEKTNSDLKLSDLIASLTLDNCGLNIANIWDITYYAFHDQLKRMGWRDQFNINNQAALAGAKIKKEQLKHWMRSISSE